MVPALHGVNLSIEEGVFLAIAGPSGSGKSTLLNLIGCIDTPTSGKIHIAGRDTSGHTPDELADLRARTIGFIFQTFNLLPVLSAEENVEYPLLQFKEISRTERRERVARFLDIALREVRTPPPLGVEWRAAAAGRDRAGTGDAAQDHPGRRADGESR